MNTTAVAVDGEIRERVPEAVGTDGLVPVRPWGPITASTAPRFRKLIREHARRGDVRLLVDLEAVTAMDVCGVAALLDGQKVITACGGGVMVLRVNPGVSRALKLTGTISAFRIRNGNGNGNGT